MSAFRKLQCREGYRRGRRLWAVRVDQNMLVWPERGDAAKGKNEPTLTDAATATSVRFSSNCELVYAVMLDSNWLVIEVALAHG